MRREKIIAELERGGAILVTNPDPMRLGAQTVYGLMPGGKTVSAAQFEALQPRLEPVGDGLFGTSQTYRLREG